jgi:hypothetical protein
MKEKYEKIMEKKISSSIETLCKGFPGILHLNNFNLDEIPAFIHYTRDLKFDDRPDYGFLRRLFKTIFEREKLEFDNDFDWFKLQGTKNEKSEDSKLIMNEVAEKKESGLLVNNSNLNTGVKTNSNPKLNTYEGNLHFYITDQNKKKDTSSKNNKILKK